MSNIAIKYVFIDILVFDYITFPIYVFIEPHTLVTFRAMDMEKFYQPFMWEQHIMNLLNINEMRSDMIGAMAVVSAHTKL